MDTLSRDKVTDKIRKLMALSQSSNVHEAEVAAAAAQRFMLEYKIAASEITTETPSEDIVMDAEVYYDLGLKSRPVWHSMLLGSIGRANLCQIVLDCERVPGTFTTRHIYQIIGTEADRATVKYLYEMLRREIERLCVVQAALFGYGRAERASFKVGAASSISHKVMGEAQRFKEEARQQHDNRAIAVIDKTHDALTRFMRQKFPFLKTGRRVTVSRMDAYQHGREVGKDVVVSGERSAFSVGLRGLGSGQPGCH